MKRRLSEKEIVDALHTTLGKVCLASEKLGCLPEVIYARARTSPKVRGAIRFYRGKLLDAAESALWKGILDNESWAVRLALTLWGRSRDFSDGAEMWHSPQSADEELPAGYYRNIALELVNNNDYVAYCRARELDSESRPVCGASQPRGVETGAAPGSDRPRDHGDDSGKNGADSGR